MKILVSPSLLSADFGKLADEARRAEAAGADWLHLDVMDGHFVDNITIGPVVVKAVKKAVNIPLDVHLMIENPAKYIEPFCKAGADVISFHMEVCKSGDDAGEIIAMIKSLGAKAAIALNPGTEISVIEGLLDKLDMVLLMTVWPGFAGQSFIADVMPKAEQLRSRYDRFIEVDGGINAETGKQAVASGADVLVAGSYTFGAEDMAAAIKGLKDYK